MKRVSIFLLSLVMALALARPAFALVDGADLDFNAYNKKVLNCEEVPKSKKLLKFTLDDGSGKERIILSGIKNFYNAEELVGKTLLAITNLAPSQMMRLESCGMLLSPVCEYEGEKHLNLIMLDSKIPAGAKIY